MFAETFACVRATPFGAEVDQVNRTNAESSSGTGAIRLAVGAGRGSRHTESAKGQGRAGACLRTPPPARGGEDGA